MREEDDILVAYALRFDGVKYQERHPFDVKRAVHGFQRTGKWRISPMKQLAVFSVLAEFIYKFGGSGVPRTLAPWMVMRSMFLLIAGYDIPKQYRRRWHYERWQREYEPGLADHVALIRQLHENTEYSPGFVPEAPKTDSRPLRAISIRQPYVELILRGFKKFEYRSQPTNLRETVYLYASLTPANDWADHLEQIDGAVPGELPTGVIVGTVEIAGCEWDEKLKVHAYALKNPRRSEQVLHPMNRLPPVFWKPRFK